MSLPFDCTKHPASMPFRKCPVNVVVFILLTPPWTAHRLPRCAPPPLPSSHTMRRVRVRAAVCGLRCRAEVMGSSRKVRSRVHGGVTETQLWPMFVYFFGCAFFSSQLRFLPRGGCVQCVPPCSTQTNRVTAQPVFVFLSLLNLPPTGKRPISSRHMGVGEFSTLHPPWLPVKSFVFVHVKSGVYLYPHTGSLSNEPAVCFGLFQAVLSSNNIVSLFPISKQFIHFWHFSI